MSSANEKSEDLCSRCAKQTDCGYKPTEETLVLIRCLDFSQREEVEEKK